MNASLKSYLIIILTLLIGFGAGFMVNGYLLRRKVERVKRFMEGRSQVAEQIIQALELEEAEERKVRPILVQHFEEVHQLQKGFRRDLHRQTKQLIDTLAPYLNEDQEKLLIQKLRPVRRRGPNAPPGHAPPRPAPN